MQRRFVVALLCAATAVVVAPVAAQEPEYAVSRVCGEGVPPLDAPRLVVHVIDTVGDPLPGATVTLQRRGDVLRTVQTDAHGHATLEGLPADTLRLAVRLNGFRHASVEKLRLKRSCINTISIPLTLGRL
jgi:hypothetical protein